MKKFFSFVLLILMLLSLTGCRWIKESSEYVRTTTEQFFQYIAVDDYSNASSLLHPNSVPDKSSLRSYILKLEDRHDVLFSEGIVIKKSTDFSFVGYTSEFNGSTYEITYNVNIGGTNIDLYVFILNDNSGKGIYRFDLEG